METRNPKHKEVGQAMHALRAYKKALELAKGVTESEGEFSYRILEDHSGAYIHLTADETKTPLPDTMKPISEWAAMGRPVRLAMIGLKSHKIDLRKAAADHVQFSLNVITGEAFLHRNGDRLEGKPQTIDEWASIGRAIERARFESLKMAQEYGNDEAAEAEHKLMVELGIIREPRTAVPASK